MYLYTIHTTHSTVHLHTTPETVVATIAQILSAHRESLRGKSTGWMRPYPLLILTCFWSWCHWWSFFFWGWGFQFSLDVWFSGIFFFFSQPPQGAFWSKQTAGTTGNSILIFWKVGHPNCFPYSRLYALCLGMLVADYLNASPPCLTPWT